MDRIEKLRIKALENEFCPHEFHYKFFKHYEDDANEVFEEKYSDAFYYALSNLTPSISEGELIVGKSQFELSDEEKSEWFGKYKDIALENQKRAGDGQDSHMAIDYDLLLDMGICGILKKIEGYMKECTEDKIAFYKSCKKCLEAVIVLSDKYADAAEKLAESEEDETRRNELLKISQICRSVPKNPANGFYEAIQSVHFITHCLSYLPFRCGCLQFQLGHPDRYLYKYYMKDMKEGKITKEYAQLLLDCLGIQINFRVHNGLSSGYMVGGREKNGEAVGNDLTEMCMQVIDDIRLVYPSVGLCVCSETDDKYIEKACEILLHGRSHPAIFGDDTIAKGLMYYGVPKNDAYNYIHSTCVEITPVASSNVWVASPYTNMPQILLDIMDREYENFDELTHKFFEVTDKKIKENYETENEIRIYRSKHSLNPLLSCFVNDCLKNGIDIERGGARYNWIMPSFVGMANLVDSLYVIKEVVFEKKMLGICEFKKILEKDFEGYEEFRQAILNKIPKYGNDIDDVDKYFDFIIEHIISECEKYIPVHKNGRIIPSVFCWIMHEQFGTMTGATPDGRKKGFPLGDGSGPCQGREMNGPTASILSSTKWEHHKLIGGVAVNMKFSKASLGDKSAKTLTGLVKSYIQRGGFEIQINVVDKEILEKAIENPEDYRDLVVRIGGYSDYFVTLSPQMQREILLRTEHCL